MNWLHYYIVWPCVAIACIGFGMMGAGYKDVATTSVRNEATITAIIKYVPSDQQLKAIGDIRI